MLLVDTNVLVDVFQDDPDWADWSIGQLRAQARIHQLAIDGIVYAELSAAFVRYEELDDAVSRLGLALLDIPRPALFLAGKAFVRYRKASGGKSSVLPDFLIGVTRQSSSWLCSCATCADTAVTFQASGCWRRETCAERRSWLPPGSAPATCRAHSPRTSVSPPRRSERSTSAAEQ